MNKITINYLSNCTFGKKTAFITLLNLTYISYNYTVTRIHESENNINIDNNCKQIL